MLLTSDRISRELLVTQPTHTSLREFTVLMASLMSVIAISIDALLPALGDIGAEFRLANPNHAQYIISTLFMGMALGQLICGPLSDALGRKRVLYYGFGLYFVGTLISLQAHDFYLLLAGRFIQGLGVASPYVSTMSIVRDRYSGRDMARVMSVIMMIFIMVPAIAPTLGQGIMLLGNWRHIFVLYVFYALAVGAWLAVRLDETLPLEKRIPFHAANIIAGFREVINNRVTMSYMVCIGICFGSFIGYLNTSRQIFQVQFGTGKMFTVYFGALALVFGVASLLNSRFVAKLGMHYICHRAVLIIIAASAIFLALHAVAEIKLWMFLLYAALLFFAIGLMFGNMNAIAMEPMEHVAGIASAVIGAVSSLISMTLGAAIGQLYDNSLVPIVTGFLVLNLMAFCIILFAGRSKPAAPVTAVAVD